MSRFEGPSKPLSSEQIRALDDRAVRKAGVPGLFLMECAADSIGRWVQERCLGLLEHHGSRVLVGKGNNGGDGLAVARFLAQRGFETELWRVDCSSDTEGRRLTDAAIESGVCRLLGVREADPHGPDQIATALEKSSPFPGLWIDALLGTGFRGDLREPFQRVIRALNARAEYVVSIDVPSGLDADRGLPRPVAVIARATLTLGAMKTGLRDAPHFAGRVAVLPVGWPARCLEDPPPTA